MKFKEEMGGCSWDRWCQGVWGGCKWEQRHRSRVPGRQGSSMEQGHTKEGSSRPTAEACPPSLTHTAFPGSFLENND